ncbi:hypothetical protein [Prauserella cavernicola]|uniref:Uncharacterized protein n=1 Tax=Prauserella cavernicola TaxID=2800127 RepID=A0A934QQY3_9PSEU|nr:hypothetical protein [Prauserella cavernicola]MBK1783779.1 hypothetical protein [Prauserella cavernicola]
METRLWIAVDQGWVRADQVVQVRHARATSGVSSQNQYQVRVRLATPDGTADRFGPSEHVFAAVAEQETAAHIAEELVRYLYRSGDQAIGIIVLSKGKVTSERR